MCVCVCLYGGGGGLEKACASIFLFLTFLTYVSKAPDPTQIHFHQYWSFLGMTLLLLLAVCMTHGSHRNCCQVFWFLLPTVLVPGSRCSTVNLSRVVPEGMLVFFPSYTIMDKTLEFWRVGHTLTHTHTHTHIPANTHTVLCDEVSYWF